MTATVDLAVIGAGPAGMAAAEEAASHGVGVVVLDEQPEPGGQIYRNIGTNLLHDGNEALNDILGPDYKQGATLSRRFVMACEDGRVDHRTDATVWQVDPNRTIHFSQNGRPGALSARRIVIASGAMERPVPIPGWTLPGVMSAGAAQIMLKTAGAFPDGPVVIAGCGPLLLLVARQLLDAGAPVAALLETTRFSDYFAVLPKLPGALRDVRSLRKGMAMRRRIDRAGVPIHAGVSGLMAVGDGRVEAVRFTRQGTARQIEAATLLLHQGVVPNVQITRQLGCTHVWSDAQRCWHPVLDEWGNTSASGITVAGDGGGIAGAEAASVAGRLAGLGAACALGRIDARQRDGLAGPLRRALGRHRAIRPFLDALFRPSEDILAPPDDETVVCRCEEVTAGQVREAAALGAAGPNQMKAYLRCGMGPCQGRLCGLTVAEIIAAARGQSMEETGYYRIRAPIKPLTLGELAGIDG